MGASGVVKNEIRVLLRSPSGHALMRVLGPLFVW